jgi:carboxyl-terminal processing protease
MENKNKYAYLFPLILAVVLASGTWLGYKIATNGSDISVNYGNAKFQKLMEILDILDKKYVDSVKAEDLFEASISDMLMQLDPHSQYIAAKDLKKMTESIEGKFGGIGIRFFLFRDTICVTNVIEGSPSQALGIRSGDKIIKVNGKKVTGIKITNDSVMALLKGPENTFVDLEIKRKGKVLKVKVQRGSIPIESISASFMMNATTGYIKIDQFSIFTGQEFRQAANSLKAQGMKSLVLDLRDNGGGVLQSAIEIADELLPNKVPLLKTKGKSMPEQIYYATSQGTLENTPVSVLINSNSASASEILAGALQDNDRGTIVGRRSFGKGLVQEDIQLRDGSSLRLTIARYYTPTGRCIQKPYDEGYEEYYESYLEGLENGELFAPDSSAFNDSLKFKTPKGKIVYGGGGIMPDIFVPLDTSGMSNYYKALRFGGVFNAYAFDYVYNKNHTWSSFENFNKSYTVTDAVLADFVKFAFNEFDIPTEQIKSVKSKALFSKTIKAEVARQIWLENGYFKIMNAYDTEVHQAIKSLK